MKRTRRGYFAFAVSFCSELNIGDSTMSSVVDKAVSAFSSKDVKLAAYWAKLYRSHGYNPLPSRSDAKRPFVRYAEYWEKAYPAEEFGLSAVPLAKSPGLHAVNGSACTA